MQRNMVINFILFQIGWFACVIGAAKQMPWLGVAVVLAIVVWHLIQAKQPKRELALLLIVLVIGGTFDQMMLNHQLISYESHSWMNALVPVWILALWAEFVTILNVSLRWMHDRWLIAVLFGAIGGPLAYMGAARLGAVTLNMMPASYIALSIGWAILTPLMLRLSAKFDGFKY
ncbi:MULTISPECIES: DUF2878 domain-containing protein [Methylotenera]|uniref:DUF2878 domain-containing protein n=1 Tax=Methylotenera TaxID=359407 RepID=UPI0003714E02|nr:MULTISPECIES: DUF2878 domain-containing protein [Methylotenera]